MQYCEVSGDFSFNVMSKAKSIKGIKYISTDTLKIIKINKDLSANFIFYTAFEILKINHLK